MTDLDPYVIRDYLWKRYMDALDRSMCRQNDPDLSESQILYLNEEVARRKDTYTRFMEENFKDDDTQEVPRPEGGDVQGSPEPR